MIFAEASPSPEQLGLLVLGIGFLLSAAVHLKTLFSRPHQAIDEELVRRADLDKELARLWAKVTEEATYCHQANHGVRKSLYRLMLRIEARLKRLETLIENEHSPAGGGQS